MPFIKEGKLKTVLEYLFCAMGAIIAAFAVEEFLVPNTILDGGVVGISIIVSALSGINLSLLTFLINIPFILIGKKKLGNKFFFRAIFSIFILSVFLEIFRPIENFTEVPLLAVCFGGVLLGAGVGIVIRGGGCLDGTETVAILLNRKFNIGVGTVVLIFNIVIYIVAGAVFEWDRAMYSLLTYFIASRVLNLVESGLEQAKAAMIITEDAKEVADQIYKKLGRTVTIMQGEGLVSGKKAILYCVITRFEINTLRSIINNAEGSSFVTVSHVDEIIGTHIKSVDKRLDEKKEKDPE